MTNSAGQESWPKMLLTGAQMLFVAFGALVLVPLLTGLDPSVALFTAGIGTLVFHGVTKQTVPVFLASSFAFIAPIQGSIASFGVSATLGGLMAAGLVYVAISQAVRLKGTAWLHRLLPAVVVGPVIMVIGLALAPVAVSMATGETSDNISYGQAIFLSMASLLVTGLLAERGSGLRRVVPSIGGSARGCAWG
ncbi:MAG: solute carrier family 23 protein, partial [Pseudomonadota bacterium]|nr:solute carrier family 23 protein [Pseudomonadota bacterium]